MADCWVADDVDERGLTGTQSTFEGRAELLRPRDVLTVTIHELEHPVVALVWQYFERISPAFQERHLVEARPPGTVVPQNRHDRQAIATRSFEIEPANTQPAVPDYKHDLLFGPRQLSADGHANAVANGRQRTRIDNLAGKASVQPLRHPATQREAVDHDCRVLIDYFTKLPRNPRRVYRCVVVMLVLQGDDCSIKVGSNFGDLPKPVRLALPPPIGGACCIGQLLKNEFGVTDQGDLCRYMEADPRRRSVSLNVACGFIPSGCLAELLATPEPKTDHQYHVGAPGERLLPWTSNCERVVLRDSTLPGPAGVHRYLRELNEFAELGCRARPKDSVSCCD